MTFAEAWHIYEEAKNRETQARREVLARNVKESRRDYEQFIAPRRPRGVLRWMLIGDYERCLYERQRLSDRHQQAEAAISAFDSEMKRSGSRLIQEIWQRAEQSCNARDPQIMRAIHKERRRLAERRRLLEALRRFNFETGDTHRLAELQENRAEKREATLVGRINFDDEPYAMTTTDSGRTFDLYPWDNAMQEHIGRACWFWYDQKGRPRFKPSIGVRGPLVLGAQPFSAARPERGSAAQSGDGNPS